MNAQQEEKLHAEIDRTHSVLLIESDPRLPRFWETALSDGGFQVVIAATPNDALQHAAQEAPNLACLGTGLNGSKAIGILEALRQISPGPSVAAPANPQQVKEVLDAMESHGDVTAGSPLKVDQITIPVTDALASEAEVTERNSKYNGLYLYGIIRDNQERRWSLTGIRGAPTIYTICHDDLSAIVSNGSGEIYETTPEDLLVHNSVLEEVMKTHSVLPLRVGTVAQSHAEVRAFLQKADRPLRHALIQIEHKVEFDVEAEWNGDEIFRVIEGQDEDIRKYKERVSAAGKRLGPEEQVAAGMMVAKAIARQRAEFAKAIEAELKPCSELVHSLQDRTQQTVFNAAFLVQAEQTRPFEEAIYRLGDLYGRILKFRYAGPLPCYSFVNLHVMMVEFKAVDEARRALGLGELITQSQIKQAYRKLAPQCHPDRNSTDAKAKERFEKLAASYQLLLGFCETIGGDSSQPIFLTQEGVGKTLVVISKERRPDFLGV